MHERVGSFLQAALGCKEMNDFTKCQKIRQYWPISAHNDQTTGVFRILPSSL